MKAINYRVQEDISCCANCFWSSLVGCGIGLLCCLRDPHGEESLEVDEVGICDSFEFKEEAKELRCYYCGMQHPSQECELYEEMKNCSSKNNIEVCRACFLMMFCPFHRTFTDEELNMEENDDEQN